MPSLGVLILSAKKEVSGLERALMEHELTRWP